MLIVIGALSFHVTSHMFLSLSFTMDKFGRIRSKISNTGFWSCSSLKDERSNCKSSSKCLVLTSLTALISLICRSNSAQTIHIQFSLQYIELHQEKLEKNLKLNTLDFVVHEVSLRGFR